MSARNVEIAVKLVGLVAELSMTGQKIRIVNAFYFFNIAFRFPFSSVLRDERAIGWQIRANTRFFKKTKKIMEN